jgi:hypothetical protein
MRTPSVPQSAAGTSNGSNGHGGRSTSSHRGWWLALAAVVPLGLSLLALRLKTQRDPVLDDYEEWWRARAAAREAGAPLPAPPAKIPTLFI